MSNLRPTDLTCKEVVELITDYLESALPEEERTRFEQHLVTCPGCKEYIRQMHQTIAAVRKLTEDEVPSRLKEDLVDAFRDWRRRHQR